MPESNIRCEEVVRNLLAFLDGEIDEDRRGRIEQHLHECRSCCSRADFELALRDKVREVGTEQPPSDLRDRIRQLLDQF
jgi:anti-sigma factor (TIGR02949 family)